MPAIRLGFLVALATIVAGLTAGCQGHPAVPGQEHLVSAGSRTVPSAPVAPVPNAGSADPRTPNLRPAPRYLSRSYRAPARLVRRGYGGRLLIAGSGISAPVDEVGLDGSAMAVPNDPSRVGWLRTTAAVGDLVGASVISGHVSDDHDVPGAFGRLRRARPGTVILWIGVHGDRHRFVVTGVHRYPRSAGVPAALFRADGPHLLHLVTCASRRRTSSGGFHYTANLVVTARALPGTS